MSTAAAWDALPLPIPAGRSHLVVIEGGDEASASPRQGVAAWVLAVPRWMRLAVTLSVVAVAMSMALGVGAGGSGATAAPLGSVEVRAGQTLSEIARAEMPGIATVEAVARIQLANEMPSTQITAGQVLVIPAY